MATVKVGGRPSVEVSGGPKIEDIKATSGALHVHLANEIAGEDATRDVVKVLHGMKYTAINASGVTVVKAQSGTFYGYEILAAAGAHTMTVFDNSTTNSGQNLIPTAGVSVNAAAEKFWNPGKDFTNGLTVNLSGNPTDNLVLIWWR